MLLTYTDFQITDNFNISEFHCNNGVRVPHKYVANAVYVAIQLQRLRHYLGNPTITINSAYRTEGYNNQIGGSINSNHKTASAVDIKTQKYTANELYSKILLAVKHGIIPNGEVLKYPTFVHYAPRYEHKFARESVMPPF